MTDLAELKRAVLTANEEGVDLIEWITSRPQELLAIIERVEVAERAAKVVDTDATRMAALDNESPLIDGDGTWGYYTDYGPMNSLRELADAILAKSGPALNLPPEEPK